jgi:flavin-dependent dehydrogenase
MNALRPVEILGGGLAGLGLALGLRRAGIPVVLHEAGDYPRHRVCGEFITSLDDVTIERLDLRAHLTDALSATSVAWFHGHKLTHKHNLPTPARCLSRHALDQRLAEALTAAGGAIHTRSRQKLEPAEGRVIAAGRRPNPNAPWIGLKIHLSDLTLAADLELHLGRRAYVGLTPIEDQRINLCGLFHRDNIDSQPREPADVLIAHLHGAELDHLAARVGQATLRADSRCAVAGLDYRHAPSDASTAGLGDHASLIPPFTGHGMTIALQSARLALDPLIAWSRHEQDWPTTLRKIDQQLQQYLGPKNRRASWLHGWLLQPSRQRVLLGLAKYRMLPTRTVYHLLH